MGSYTIGGYVYTVWVIHVYIVCIVVMLLMTSSVSHIYDMLVDWQAQELSQVTRSSKLMARLANAQQESPGLQALSVVARVLSRHSRMSWPT